MDIPEEEKKTLEVDDLLARSYHVEAEELALHKALLVS
jgi:hypothetical protein